MKHSLCYLFVLVLINNTTPSCGQQSNQEVDWHKAWQQRQATERSLTLLQNKNDLLPFKELEQHQFAALSIGRAPALDAFETTLQLYAPVKCFSAEINSIQRGNELLEKLMPFDVVIVALRSSEEDKLIDLPVTYLLERLSKQAKVVLVIFGNPWQVLQVGKVDDWQAVALAYSSTPEAQELMAQAIFGAIGFQGKLPFDLSPLFEKGAGIETKPLGRLKFTWPEELGIHRSQLKKIETIVEEAIAGKAFPGCVILAAKEGKVFYYKAFGFHTYDSLVAVQRHHLFDLASITKISASAAALMKLFEEQQIDLEKPFSHYHPLWASSNKRDLTLKEILSHRAGLKAWISFWQQLRQADGSLSASIFSKDSTEIFSLKVAHKLYIRRDYPDSILQQICQSPLNNRGKYVYSDLSFYFYPQLVKQLTGLGFEEYLNIHFYRPLGAATLVFNPLSKGIPPSDIVPTEIDSVFRKQLLHGTVHDEGAAMMGGVSGHAGLFGNAVDLAKLMQMYLNQGNYAGKQYLKPATVAYFTKCHFCNGNSTGSDHRGLVFDKPRTGNTAPSASLKSFGHLGFTGTYTWADPAHQLLFVFLSNRVYPTRTNQRIVERNIRAKLLEAVYDLLRQK